MQKANKRVKVSVIVPAYNAEKYIARCVESIISQSYHNLEIIIVDDGSMDDTTRICSAYVQEDERVALYCNSNHGVSFARNFGIEHATGDYIMFVDADDWIEKDCVEHFLDIVDRYKVSVVLCNYVAEPCSGKANVFRHFENKVIDVQMALNPYSEYFQCAVWGKFLLRDLIVAQEENCIQFDEAIRIGEDRLFWTQIVLRCKKIYALDEAMYHYYINDEGVMHSKDFNTMYTDYLARQRIMDLLAEYEGLYKMLIAESVYAVADILLRAERKTDKSKVRELKRYIAKNIPLFLKDSHFTIKSKGKVLLLQTPLLGKLGKMLVDNRIF